MTSALLVFGAAGQVGREAVALATQRGAPIVGLRRADADITDAIAVRAALRRHRPAVAVNAAAYTAVDRAEQEPELAHAANVVGAAVLAAAAADAGVPLIHLSTDYVFDGTKNGPYTENDPVSPLGTYARTKAAGEERVAELQPHHVILRTAWVYGVYGSNFLKTMLRLAGERDELRVVADQTGSPTATADIAEAILAIAARISTDRSLAGTYHFTGSGVTTWHGFASEIVACQRALTGRNPRVIAVATAEFPTPARRPMNSVLDNSRFRAAFGYVAQPWAERTHEVVTALLRPAEPEFLLPASASG
jgi:dTDP-4-dehydrorhamnose reductase